MKKKFKVTADLHASHGQRLANLFIDTIVFYLLIFVVTMLLFLLISMFGGQESVLNLTNSDLFIYSVTYLTILLYFIVFEFFLQKTVGKYLSKTIVVNEFGEKPTLSQIIGRTFARLIPFDAFSYLGATARGWHDTLPNLYVVDEKLFKQKKANFYDFEELGKKEDELQQTDDKEDLEVKF